MIFLPMSDYLAGFRFATFLLCFFAGLAAFIIGFIPTSIHKLEPASEASLFNKCINITQSHDICQKLTQASYPERYDHVVLIVIDALRADFIPSVSNNPEFNIKLPFLEGLVKQRKALPFISQVHSPTVTLPRIRSLVTGGVSNFMDVIMNLNAAELKEDNVLHQAKSKNLKTVFYGDDTWLKLFPNSFTRSKGTHSFFVSDFKEVDNNVTVKMKSEFDDIDWDVMILHYLGVDHIGHSHGPLSHHLPPKLREMDNIVKFIYDSLRSKSRFHSLIVVCGDHGMTSSGSHGGVSKPELLTPLIFINVNRSHNYHGVTTVDQIDFASTLSVLLGLPIPANSFGNLLSGVLRYSRFDRAQTLHAMLNNLVQLFEVHKTLFTKEAEMYRERVRNVIFNHSEALQFNESKVYVSTTNYTSILNSYFNLLNQMKEDLVTNTVGYNEACIVFGLFMIWLFFALTFMSYFFVMHRINLFKIIKSAVLYPISNIFMVSLLLMVLLFNSKVLIVVYVLIVIVYLIIRVIHFTVNNSSCTFVEKIYTSLIFLHPIGLFSSSFIEEEHQVWYFLISSIFTVYLIISLRYMIKDFLTQQTTPGRLRHFFWNNNSSISSFLILDLLLAHRVLRSWNQTGDKWQHLPDISDWLNKGDNAGYASTLGILSQFLILLCFIEVHKCIISFSSMCIGSVLIYFYHYQNAWLCRFVKKFKVGITVVPWLVYFLIFTLIFTKIFKISRTKLTLQMMIVWLLLIQLIGRTHNIPIIAATVVLDVVLHKILRLTVSGVFRMFFYTLMAMGSFFYLGNSNSLSTIDVNSGYVGLPSYQPIVVGFLITCNTYSLVVLWFMLLIHRIQVICPDRKIHSIIHLLVYKMFVLAIYCIVMYIMKHHLFFLSVFAPKLFYEVCHVILIVIITWFIMFSCIYNYR